MNIKGAIFDLDGTLMDSMFIWETIGSEYLISRGLIPEEGLNKIFKNMSIIQAAEYYRKNYGLTESVETIVDEVNKMIEHLYFYNVKAKDGVLEFLDELKNQGVKMCVATATDKYMAKAVLKRNGILDYFCGILTCTEVGSGKDTPLIYEEGLKLLNTSKDETFIFEDALYAIKTAKQAKFNVVAVYDKFGENESDEIKKICDYYIKSFRNWGEVVNEKGIDNSRVRL